MPQFDEKRQNIRLDELHRKEAEELAKILSVKYGVQYIDLSTVPVNTDSLRIIPEKVSREINVAIF